MPEGDSLFRFARRVGAALEGETITAARAHGPGPTPQVQRIVGSTCTGVRSQGKNLIISFDNGLALRGHLRMYGTWHIYQPGEEWTKPEREARLVLQSANVVVVNFSAPVIEMLEERALGLHSPLAGLGPDLLSPDFDAEEAFRRLRADERRTVTIGDAIMDQRAMAGIGNIWKHETLFRCAINPWRVVGELSDEELRGIIAKARELLEASIGRPGPDGKKPRRPTMFVYGRPGQPCRRCYRRLESRHQGRDIRYTTWCPKCQPEVPGQQVSPPARVRRSG